jgi:hypothetical protein
MAFDQNDLVHIKFVSSFCHKWQKKTGHQSLPGTHIHGNVCVIQKVQDDAA